LVEGVVVAAIAGQIRQVGFERADALAQDLRLALGQRHGPAVMRIGQIDRGE